MTTAVREAPHHDKLTCYTDYSCRRPECVERKNEWQRELRRKQREGQPSLIDAGPVRRHILALQAAGTSIYRIALTAGIDDWTVRAFLPSRDGRRVKKHSTSPEVARKILEVTAELAASGYVDGTGTRRRIQALVAQGWPLRRVHEHLGLNASYVGDLIRRTEQGKPIYVGTAEKVAHAYERLKNQRPARHGIEARFIKRSRQLAAAKRWPTVKYWADRMDAIDDPHFTPLYGITRGELLAADGRELLALGVRIDQAAARLGISRNHLQQELLRHPAPETELAA